MIGRTAPYLLLFRAHLLATGRLTSTGLRPLVIAMTAVALGGVAYYAHSPLKGRVALSRRHRLRIAAAIVIWGWGYALLFFLTGIPVVVLGVTWLLLTLAVCCGVFVVMRSKLGKGRER